ncbi:hypothetical protein L226DRAFT_613915 [Lentinus tigrinus ALCF2SS1-7]|uniref:uncharacterized protein n=1 Tax=Lentinus tigrinus ALCF2SS1-7 TaxID=1328758 RepID=UPI00116622EE|nr:hypothetical protein L226DRAFT_613915 [Lentinus tigrinus ALCF2SS1-7]
MSNTLFVRHLLYFLVTAGNPLDEVSLVLILAVLCSRESLEVCCILFKAVTRLQRCCELLWNVRPSSPFPTKTAPCPHPRAHHRPSGVSRPSKLSARANPTVQVDLVAFQTLTQERLQLHLKAKASERNAAILRERIWFLEEANVTLRADITQRAKQQEQQADEKAALVEEKEALASERDWMTGDRDRIVEENKSLRAEVQLLKASESGLVADMEELQAENEDLIDGKEALLAEKMADEEKLAQESARRRQAEVMVKGLRQERDALESQLASKQETLNDIMDESDALEDDLQAAKRSLKDAQCDLTTLQTTHTNTLDEVAALKAELAALRESTCPVSELQALCAELASAKDSLLHLQAQNSQQADDLDLCRTALTSANEERDNLRDSLEAMRGHYHMAEDVKEVLLKSLEEQDVELSRLEDALADRDATIATQETAIAAREASLAEREIALDEVVSALSQRDDALAKAGVALAECEASFAELNAAIASRDRKIDDLQTYVAGLEGVVQFLKLEASATGSPGSPVKVASTLSQSFYRPTSGSRAPSPTKANTSTPSTPEAPAPLMLPTRDSSSSSPSPVSSHTSDAGSLRRSWFF